MSIASLLNPLPPWVEAIGVAAIIAGTLGYIGVHERGIGYADGAAAVQAKWDAQKLTQYQAYANDLSVHVANENKLRADFAAQDKEHHDELASLSARNDALAVELQHRSHRPAAASHEVPASAAPGGPPSVCTAAQLYWEDANAFRGEAAAAAVIGSDLTDCIKRYNDAKASLESHY